MMGQKEQPKNRPRLSSKAFQDLCAGSYTGSCFAAFILWSSNYFGTNPWLLIFYGSTIVLAFLPGAFVHRLPLARHHHALISLVFFALAFVANVPHIGLVALLIAASFRLRKRPESTAIFFVSGR